MGSTHGDAHLLSSKTVRVNLIAPLVIALVPGMKEWCAANVEAAGALWGLANIALRALTSRGIRFKLRK